MITGSLKSKIDSIWQDFYNENMTQTQDIVHQITMLMFIKMLDDKQISVEAIANEIGETPDDEILTFKSGNYKNIEIKNGSELVNFEIPYSDLRWKNFKNLNPDDLGKRIRDYVVPFVQDRTNKAVGQFADFSEEYIYGFNKKERLLAKVVDKLSDPELNFENTDVMGDVYEYMCGSGVSGQYRTPRHIIDLAVEMMKPKLGEKIMDPAFGTAGFDVESAKYIQKHQPSELLNIENRKTFENDMFYGCDTDRSMARVGYMNCVLHNIKNPTITVDSLLEAENLKDIEGKFDLVLQNPPFAGALEKEVVNSELLTICDTKSTELLFVALMTKLLKIGGRGMSVVPSGVCENSGKAFKNLRKELIDNQKLIGVISMPNGIFAAPGAKGSASKGAGVKTYYLIFQKTDNGGTDNVWFYNMENDGFTLDGKHTPIDDNDIPDIIERYNHLSEEMKRTRKDKSFMVPVDEIRKNDYSLAISKYREIEKPVITYRKTEDILKDIETSYSNEATIIAELKKKMGV